MLALPAPRLAGGFGRRGNQILLAVRQAFPGPAGAARWGNRTSGAVRAGAPYSNSRADSNTGPHRAAVGERGYDLRLTRTVKDVRSIPLAGKRLIIVAAVQNVLHFRIHDGDGNMAVDTDETTLTKEAGRIGELSKQLESLWPPHGSAKTSAPG